MTRLTTATACLAFLLALPGDAQIRNVTINTESDEGKLLQQAGDQTDPNAKIKLLEEFLAKYASHDAAGYVHLQLLTEYLKLNNFDKAFEHGRQAQPKAPEDLELAHFVVKAAEGKGDAATLAQVVEATHAMAQKAASAPKPSDAEEEAGWKRNIEFAGQVEQYNQHALFGVALKQTQPQAKELLLDCLRKNYPGGQFDKNLDAQYVDVYRQLGKMAEMAKAAEGALAGEPDNEAFLYIVGESYLDPARGNLAQSQTNAEKILSTLPNKAKPQGIDDAAWATHKSTYLGLANSLLGRSLASQGKYAPAQKVLLGAAKELKGNNDAVAPVYFYLGFCAVKLNQTSAALNYLGQAAKIPGPYQAPANDLLTKVRAAVSGR
jgi:tetratricopeptide (TPR) repeat protein